MEGSATHALSQHWQQVARARLSLVGEGVDLHLRLVSLPTPHEQSVVFPTAGPGGREWLMNNVERKPQLL